MEPKAKDDKGNTKDHKHRVLELNTNIRSGDDRWFSDVLDECRRGELSDANYRFLHGLPTTAPISFWYAFKDAAVQPHDVQQQCDVQNPCKACLQEIHRRNRVLHADTAEGAARKLADPHFKNCVLITPFHKAVFQCAIHRAQKFAIGNGHQLFWMQAIDNWRPNWRR